MGEIRVKVLLTNAADEMLHLEKKLPAKKVRRYEADALVDTGSVRSVIPQHVLEKLGLEMRSTRVVELADGRKEPVGISEAILFEVMGRDTLEDAIVNGDEVLLGQTFLETNDLHADCRNQHLVPNPAHPDQPVF
jgi:clan AA aspartic protease